MIEKLASPESRIVSPTITEGGSYVREGTGRLDDRHPDIVHDLAHPDRPAGTFGYLAGALDRRRERGLPLFMVMSCDNLQINGNIARTMFLSFLELRAPSLARKIEANGSFPK